MDARPVARGLMTYWKVMLWLAAWVVGLPLVFLSIIAAIYIFRGPAADRLN